MNGRLSGGTAFMMAAVAFFFVDTLHFVLDFIWLGFIANFLGVIIFWPWLKAHGISMWSSSVATKTWITIIIESLPIFFFVPTWTIYIVALYMSDIPPNSEDIIGEWVSPRG